MSGRLWPRFLLTAGLYFFPWTLSAARRVDRDLAPARRSSTWMLLFAVGVPTGWLFGLALLLSPGVRGGASLPPLVAAAFAIVVPLYMAGVVAGLVAFPRTWSNIATAQRDRGLPVTADPWLLAGILLLPVVGILVWGPWVVSRTERMMAELGESPPTARVVA
jgi:formate/nitrite transporter FocA (FNT family)